ncbi:MAG: Spy/CpxP family protein refolding chaperone [Massilia sp.]
MNTINTIGKRILIGMTVLGLSATSFAVQAQDSQGERGQGQARWAERAAMHQQRLHDTLKLTASQEGAWANYVAAMKPAERTHQGQRGAWKTMSAPQRMEQRITMGKAHLAAMETRLAALNSFYSVLTPAQKSSFDAASMGHGRHGHHQRGGHEGQHPVS